MKIKNIQAPARRRYCRWRARTVAFRGSRSLINGITADKQLLWLRIDRNIERFKYKKLIRHCCYHAKLLSGWWHQ